MKRTHIILSLLLLFALLLTACATVVADPSTDPTETQASTKATQTDPTSTTNSTESSDYTDVTDPSESAVQTEATNPSETVDSDEEFREYILSRTPIPEEEYSSTVVCTPVLDPVGYVGPSPSVGIITSAVHIDTTDPEHREERVDGCYTDALCPISYHDLLNQYSEDFYIDYVLIGVVVQSQNGVLPEVARIDVGEPEHEVKQVLVYIDNVIEDPDDLQWYRVCIEFPRSYINFDVVYPMLVVTAVDDTSSYEDYWAWETAE